MYDGSVLYLQVLFQNMPSKTLAFLHNIFHPFPRILGMSASPLDLNTNDFTNRMSVEDWRRSLVKIYTSRDLELGPKYRARMSRLQVVRIRRYKERQGPRHEYLVAEIAVSALLTVTHLRM